MQDARYGMYDSRCMMHDARCKMQDNVGYEMSPDGDILLVLAKIFNLFNLRNLCAIFGCVSATLCVYSAATLNFLNVKIVDVGYKRLLFLVFFCLFLFHLFQAENQPDGSTDGKGK